MTTHEQPMTGAIPEELREKVQELINQVFERGVEVVTAEVKKESSALMDAYQAALANPDVVSELEKRGKLPKVL